jgi:uncharacterized protein YuzE
MEARLTTRSLYYNPDTDTLDIWIGDPSKESLGEPMTDNLVSKLDTNGNIIGFEVIELSKLNNQDMKKMPKEVRDLLKESADRLSIVSHPRS